MSVARNKDEFVSRMREALGENITNPNNPSEEQVRRYFRTLNGRTQDAIEAYEGYATLFFIHVDNSSNPNNTVTYPGGAGDGVCDNFAEVLSRNSENGRHVIDCRGFAVMGVTLLMEAGFRFSRYMIAIPPSARTPGEWTGHVIAEMITPDGRRVYIGNNRIHPYAANAVSHLAGWSPDDEINVRYGSGNTIREATDDADEIVTQRSRNPLSDPSIIAPLRSRRSFVPPLSRE